jgi:KDO2-lipid IV(A) lauroyltransferase
VTWFGAPNFRMLATEVQDLALHYAMRALPTEACSDLGARLGLLIGRRGHPAAERRSRAVLARLCRPQDEAALEASVTRLWQNVGRSYAEFSILPRLLREGRIAPAEPALFTAECSDTSPLIVCFLHLGNWELLGARMVQALPDRATAVVLRPTNRAHALIIREQRRHLRTELLELDRHVWRHVAERLQRRGGVLWLAADEAHGGRVFAPFLGRPPSLDGNLGKMVRLASATGARIMPVYAERHPGVRFTIHALPPVRVTAERRDHAALLDAVSRLDRMIEPIIRRLAEQWYMAIEFGGLPDPAPADFGREPA